MEPLNIYYLHSMMFHGRVWHLAAELLQEHGINLQFIDTASELETGDREKNIDILVADLSLGNQMTENIHTAAEHIDHRLEISSLLPTSFTTFDSDTTRIFADYTKKISAHNYAGAILLLVAMAGFDVAVPEKKPVESCGVYHPESKATWSGVDEYTAWRVANGKTTQRPVAVLFYYGQLVEDSLGEIDALIQGLEKNELCPVAIFSEGIEHTSKAPDWYSFLEAIQALGAIINCQAGRLLKQQLDTALLEKLDVPIIQTLRSYSQTEEQWQNDPQGLPSMSAVFSQTYPEMFGAIRPTMIGALRETTLEDQRKNSWMRHYSPIDERIDTLCGRLLRQFHLRDTPNYDKKVTIVLHNNPCKGVEATVGMAVGLDSFTSLGLLLESLRMGGYDTGDAPTDGKAILTEIMTKKAIAEFRWTTIDEIVTKGGALYMMGKAEYHNWFDAQDETVQQKILADWGEFPGQGMAWKQEDEDVLVITGLKYGKIQIMNQPKRGCYGAKCTGEVCRILHDPHLAPPHHWFATYKYIQDTSDAVIHFGTEGALEYLPGKQNGLSGSCFSEISLGTLPNFYVYVMDAIGEGMVAKRRGQATLVDHLGPVLSPAVLGENLVSLENLLNQYSQAQSSGDSNRIAVLTKQLRTQLHELELSTENSELPFEEQLDQATRRIAAIKRTLSPEGLHILGSPPDQKSRGRLLATMLRKPAAGLPSTDELGMLFKNGKGNHNQVAEMLQEVTAQSQCSKVLPPALQRFCLEVERKLAQCPREIDEVLHALSGGYISPGPAGSLTDTRIESLPAGKNFYAKDVSQLPTKAALEVGEMMVTRLLQKYLDEEGEFPESIGLSIWSSDAFKSDGELFCQILTLMGLRPLWDKQDTVKELEVIPLDEMVIEHNGVQLARPRVDVTIETSGIMRDMVPHFCDFLDKAVLAVAGLDEPDERNFIKKHTDQHLAELRADTHSTLSTKEMQRLATFRVFSSAPGTYGTGVGLALDASAWTTDKELAEIYINWAGHGYGDAGVSTAARDTFARQMAGLDIAYMKQASEEYDILDCGCYAVGLGSMAAATRAQGKKQPRLYWSEAGGDKELTDVSEQLQRSVATRLLNSAWIESMKKHGHQGAMAVSNRVNNLYKWSATSHAVSKKMFDQIVATYIQNEENRQWLVRDNPYSMEEITRRLLEAASRNLWQPDEDMLEAVQQAALEVEGDMEEVMGDVTEEFQGNKVEVLGADQVDTWQHEWSMKNG